MQNLATGVQNEFVSKQTASERASKYTKNDEAQRILDEYVRKREIDARFELEKLRNETELEIKRIKAQNSMKGKDVNTGNGTRIRTTDKWGNHAGENNWEGWNDKH